MKQKYIDEAYQYWKNGQPHEAGRILYEHINVSHRPAFWPVILELCKDLIPSVSEIDVVHKIAQDQNRWQEAHEVFRAVRMLTLRAERSKNKDTICTGMLYLAENAAKVTYNASGEAAPFDHDAGWWLVSNLRDIVDQLGSPEFEARSWGNSKLPEVCRQAPLTIVAPKRASDLGLVAVAHRSPCKTWSLDAFVENMPSYDITRKSRPVVVTPYQSQWVSDFAEIAGRIRNVINNAAIRIDHIGSTAVPRLAAKDVIDIQITVADLDRADSLTRPLIAVGFRQGTTFEYDAVSRKARDRCRIA